MFAALGMLAGCSHKATIAGPVNGVKALGFDESAEKSGIHFFNHFLPREQGEPYKVNLYDHGSGVAVGDINGDGKDDVYFLNQNGANALYLNNGDGTFSDITAQAGVGLGDRVSVGAVFADYDNDGRQDLFVTSVRGGNVLFHNEGGGKFRDATAEAGVTYRGHSQSALFFDYDRDGMLDLFVTNTGKWTTDEFNREGNYYTGLSTLPEIMNAEPESNILYHNDGHGHFKDVTRQVGLRGIGWAADAVAFDYDEDGWQDLFVTNMFGRSQLYRNTGKGAFVDLTSRTLSKTSWGGMGAKAFDMNNDGRLDLYLTDMHSDMWMTREFPASAVEEKLKYPTAQGKMGGPQGASRPDATSASVEHGGTDVGLVYGNTLFRNEGSGRFTEVSDSAGVETFWPWGAATGDFNNDGSVDIFVPSGMGYPFFYWRNYLLMNNGRGLFTDHSRDFGIDPPPGGDFQAESIAGKQAARSSRAAAVADFDGDGRLDLMVSNFNGRPYYYRNRFRGGSYLELSLTGTRSNRDALGATVHLYAGRSHLVREVEGAGGYLSCPSKVVHFGLGALRSVERIEIQWPSGIRQTISSPRLNRLLRVTEAGGSRQTVIRR
jgi:hypothetical protein